MPEVEREGVSEVGSLSMLEGLYRNVIRLPFCFGVLPKSGPPSTSIIRYVTLVPFGE